MLGSQHIMLLYGINPLLIVEEIENLETEKVGYLSFGEFNAFLHLAREQNNLEDFLRNLDIIKEDRLYQRRKLDYVVYTGGEFVENLVIRCFKESDMFGKEAVKGAIYFETIFSLMNKNFLQDREVFRIPSINRKIFLNKLVLSLFFIRAEWPLARFLAYFK
jgi:hypothetical protein